MIKGAGSLGYAERLSWRDDLGGQLGRAMRSLSSQLNSEPFFPEPTEAIPLHDSKMAFQLS